MGYISIIDLLIRTLERSISEIMDLQLTNQFVLFVTTIFYYNYVLLRLCMCLSFTHKCFVGQIMFS